MWKRGLFVTLGTFVLLWVFRAPLYRLFVSYDVVGERSGVSALPLPGSTAIDLEGAIQDALDSTAARLHFSVGRVSSDPSQLAPGSPANCIGYADLCTAFLKGNLERIGLADRYSVVQPVGKLRVGPWDLHRLSDSPFWKDHDIVVVVDQQDGSKRYLDPTLYDAVGVGVVASVNAAPPISR